MRNYSYDYAELLSPQARGGAGSRLFSDADVQVLVTVANLRREDVPRAEIIERIKHGDIVVDSAPSPHQAAPSPQEGQHAPLVAQMALSSMQHQINAIQRHQATLLRAAVLWGALWGAVAALAFAAFVVYVLWLVAGY